MFMRALNFELMKLNQKNRDGSYATRDARSRILAQAANELHDLGYRGLKAHGLKSKHVEALVRQMASKGVVAVDGVSLTLVGVEDLNEQEGRFSVALIPHTLSVTTLGSRRVGDTVNIETDVLAKYVERQLAGQ